MEGWGGGGECNGLAKLMEVWRGSSVSSVPSVSYIRHCFSKDAKYRRHKTLQGCMIIITPLQ